MREMEREKNRKGVKERQMEKGGLFTTAFDNPTSSHVTRNLTSPFQRVWDLDKFRVRKKKAGRRGGDRESESERLRECTSENSD